MNFIGDKIYGLRKRKGISQEDLAFELQVARQTVSGWESGKTVPSTENLIALAELFDVGVDCFLEEKVFSAPTEAETEEEAGEEGEADEKSRADFEKLKRFVLCWVSVGVGTLFVIALIVTVFLGLVVFVPSFGTPIISAASAYMWIFVLAAVVSSLILIGEAVLVIMLVRKKK